MGLLDRLTDKMVQGVFGAETVRVPYTELANMVREVFITEKDDAYLNKTLKVAKGGVVFTKEMITDDERYKFHVGTRPNGLLWLPHKPVWILDNQENKFYQLDKDSKWKKFYATVKAFVSAEKSNRH